MRTEKEIKERLKLLQDMLKEISNKEFCSEYPVPDWNIKQFESVIWYLNWVLEESEEE